MNETTNLIDYRGTQNLSLHADLLLDERAGCIPVMSRHQSDFHMRACREGYCQRTDI